MIGLIYVKKAVLSFKYNIKFKIEYFCISLYLYNNRMIIYKSD